jgi:cation-transporting ATPase E
MTFLSIFTKRRFETILAIISRNVFLLINGIIFAVVILLTIFGDTQEGVFLGLITILNIFIGCGQEINSWLALEKLQLLVVPKVIRIENNKSESVVLVEDIKEKDILKLKTGDQIPCDGLLIDSHGFEINEALITGESAIFSKKPGDHVFAGSIVTSGTCLLAVEKVFAQSRIALMTKSIKKYSLILSPIQHSINRIIKYTGYGLLLIILFVVGRGLFVHETTVAIVQNIGALTSMLLPQGMVVIITLLFSYGAAHMYRRNILLQEVNATEKIGRIKNLCMDKTGTLTDNNIVVDQIFFSSDTYVDRAKHSITAYIQDAGESSQTIMAIKKMFAEKFDGEILGGVTFSSTRQFGAVHIRDSFGERMILVGAPDLFLAYFSNETDREWVQKYIDTEAHVGKRLLCFVESDVTMMPKDFSGLRVSAVAVIALTNNFREGVREAIEFFQTRGVKIRIISGDNIETVRAIATLAGVHNVNSYIVGSEMEKWTESDYLARAHTYSIFARIKPEQKEKIIEALKHDGFTAMVGDGANDALAIKKADVGIAMFDGAQATRQLASVVLIKNDFSDLPNGVRLADSIIQNIEICAGIFFNQVFVGFFFFLILTFFGYAIPFTPLNITFINYFTVGLPGFLIFYWIIRPVHSHIVAHNKSFLQRVIPFAFFSAIPQAIVAVFAFFDSLERAKVHGPTSLVVVSFIILGVIFFMFTPSVYSGPTTLTQKKQFALLVVAELVSVIVLMNISVVAGFYNLTVPSMRSVMEMTPLLILYGFVQYELTQKFFRSQELI